MPQESVRVLVGATLPPTVRITEAHLDIGSQTEATMRGHFLATIPGQRLGQFARQLLDLLGQNGGNGLRVFAWHPSQHHVTAVTFHQRHDLAVVAADEEIALPVARYGTVLGIGRSLTDRDGVFDPAMIGSLLRMVA